MKYTKEILSEAVSKNFSFAGVLRDLGCKLSGGMQSHIRGLVRKFEITTSHFLGQASNRGKKFPKRSAEDILILGKPEHGHMLRRALLEIGRQHQCGSCGLGNEWQALPLVLEVHHENGNRTDNRETNLKLLCPNCHSQTANYGVKNIYPSDGMHT